MNESNLQYLRNKLATAEARHARLVAYDTAADQVMKRASAEAGVSLAIIASNEFLINQCKAIIQNNPNATGWPEMLKQKEAEVLAARKYLDEHRLYVDEYNNSSVKWEINSLNKDIKELKEEIQALAGE